MIKSDEELLREYLKETILLEYVPDPAAQAARLRAGAKAAGDVLKTGVKAMAGDLKKLGTHLQFGTKRIVGNLAQALTLGLFTFDEKKINNEYLAKIAIINAESKPYKDAVDETFTKNVSPFVKASFLYNPLVTLTAVRTFKKLPDLGNKLEAAAMKIGSDDEYKQKVDAYYKAIQDAAEAAVASKKSSKESELLQRTSTSPTASRSQTNSAGGMGKLAEIKDRLEKELKQMESLGLNIGTGETLYKKHKETLDQLRQIIK